MAILPQGGAQGVSFLTPQQKKQRQQLWVLGAVALATAAVLYFGFFRDSSSTGTSPNGPMPMPGDLSASPIPQGLGQAGADPMAALGTSTEIILTGDIVEILRQISAEDLSVKNKKFGELVIHGVFPIDVGEKGRKNPFAGF